MVSEQWLAQNTWLERQEDGDFLLFVRRYDKAEEAFQEAVRAAEPFGQFDARLARSLTGLGRVFMARHDYESARLQFERALAIKRKAYGNENSDVTDLIRDAALAHAQLGHPAEARQLIDEALRLQTKLNDEASMPEAKLIAAKICVQEGKEKEAEKNLLEGTEAFLRDSRLLSHPVSTLRLESAADCVYSYCACLDRKGKKAQAEKYRARILPVQNWLNILGQSGV